MAIGLSRAWENFQRELLWLLPQLHGMERSAVRLHPRKSSKALLPSASKLGSPWFWPDGEPWPICSLPHQIAGPQANFPLIMVAQLSKQVASCVEFPAGTDTLQVLWCPCPHLTPYDSEAPDVRIYWRRSDLLSTVANNPVPADMDAYMVPPPCELSPELLIEYPTLEDLPRGWGSTLRGWRPDAYMLEAVQAPIDWDGLQLYHYSLSCAPGSKVGGYPAWHGYVTPIPPCDRCGRQLVLLLTVASSEFSSNHLRWRDIRTGETAAGVDSRGRAIGLLIGGGGEAMVFHCPDCIPPVARLHIEIL